MNVVDINHVQPLSKKIIVFFSFYVFWDMSRCRLVTHFRRFEGTYCL